MALSLTMNSRNKRYLRITLAVFSAISGLIFLSQSSFFKLQFNDTRTSEIVFFGTLSALLVFLVFMAPNWSDVFRKVWNLNFSFKLIVDCVFMGIVWLLAFLIKYPRFDVNSKYTSSCVFLGQQGNKTSNGNLYSLFSFGAFALLALLLSSETKKTMELGFFSVLVGLIMDTSLEIIATDNGPTFWYVLGSVAYCVGLIFLKHYIENSARNGDDYLDLHEAEKLRHTKRNSRETYRNTVVFFSALVGTVCLFLSPFSEQQFRDSTNLKAVFFITFSFLMGYSLLKARESMDTLAMKCHERYLVKAAVKISLFVVVSVLIFMTKYPRFELHLKHKESCKDQTRKEVISQWNRFDVYSTGSFSLFALLLSSDKEQAVRLGFFSFLLELTMDTSVEILGNNEPDFLYVFFAAVYCASLILVKCYLDSLIEKKDRSAWQLGSYQDQQKIFMVPNTEDRSLQDEQPLIESVAEKRDQEIVEIDDGSNNKETDSSNEPWPSATKDAPSRIENETELLNRKERNKARRRQKAKRERERLKEIRNQKEDLWISVV